MYNITIRITVSEKVSAAIESELLQHWLMYVSWKDWASFIICTQYR